MFILKIVFLFLLVWTTIVNTILLIHKQEVPSVNIFAQTIGATGFIVMEVYF